MSISEQDVIHGIWMLHNQLETPSDLAQFWLLFGPSIERCPRIERRTPWYQGLDEISRLRK